MVQVNLKAGPEWVTDHDNCSQIHERASIITLAMSMLRIAACFSGDGSSRKVVLAKRCTVVHTAET